VSRRRRTRWNDDWQGRGAADLITGLGASCPTGCLTNAELSTLVDTSDEWIMERTGIRERRLRAPEQALTDLALPAAQAALAQAGVEGKDIDLLLCANRDSDMMFPTSSALLADTLGARDAAAYDLLAGCTGFNVRAPRRPTGCWPRGWPSVRGRRRRRSFEDPRLDRPSTLVLFGDGAGAVVLEKVEKPGFLGFGWGRRRRRDPPLPSRQRFAQHG